MVDASPEMMSIFCGALEQASGDERLSYLEAACGQDSELRARIDALLKAHEEADAASSRKSSGVGSGTTIDVLPAEGPGTVIGPYKLVELIGEGGMGAVYLAQQTEPVKRLVALKVIKAGMDSRQVLARFETERQALALMDHPNISKVLEAGTTGSSRPYFVMELVKGVPITKFCDDRKLTPRERLELFIPVCQAVQHAHQKGVIHRDIKPTNILVALYDGRPVPKVIDFGVAKAAGQPLTDNTLVTGFGNIVGTLEYMSPEQAEVNQLDIDTRSDIYSLGVVLYELLVGSTPFTKKDLEKAGMLEMLRVIREDEPSKPSTKLGSSDALPTLSANRGTEPAKLTRIVRGELDWIVMKALEKDRNRRYETANGFAADVQRYLNDETVQACPPTTGYRLRKFARRNKRALVTASVIGLALLSAVGALGWVVRDREAGRVRTASEVNQFLQRAESLYADNKLPEAVAEVEKARGVQEAGSGDEELARRVRQWLTDLDSAMKLEEIQVESWEGDDRWYTDFARLFRERGIDVEALSAEEAAARVAASRIRLDLVIALYTWSLRLKSDPRHQDPARSQGLRAIARAADPEPWRVRWLAAVEAKDVQTVFELANRADSVRSRTRVLAHLGDSLRVAGDAEAAVAFLRKAQRQHPGDFLINSTLATALEELRPAPWDEVLAFRRVALAARPRSAWAHSSLGVAFRNKNCLDEAIVEHHEAIRLRPGLAFPHYGLGRTLAEQKKLPEAVAAYEKAIELFPKWSAPHISLGNALRAQGKLDKAIACYLKAMDIDPKQPLAHANLGNVLSDQKKLDEAIAAYETAIQIDPKNFKIYTSLGDALREQGKLDEAIAAYRKAIELNPKDAAAYNSLGMALYDQKKLDEAIAAHETAIELDPKDAIAHNNLGVDLKVQGRLEAVAALRKAIKHDPKYAVAYSNLGAALNDQWKWDEAVANLEKAIELDPKLDYAYFNLGIALSAKKKLPEAIAAYEKAIKLNPKLSARYIRLGDAMFDLKKWDQAIAAYETAIRIDPKSASAYARLGNALSEQGNLDGAITAYRKAIELDPTLRGPPFGLGNALSKQKRWDEAIAAYETAIRIDPKLAVAYANLGEVLRIQGKLDKAVVAYEKAIEIAPRYALAYLNLGNARKAQGDLDRAIAAYRTAIALDPTLVQARTDLGIVLAQKGWDLTSPDPKRAIAAGKEAVTLVPRWAFAWQFLGWVQYRAGDWKASIEALEKSCDLEKGGDCGQWIVMSLAHWKLANDKELPEGDQSRHRAEARRWYDRAVNQIDGWKARPNDWIGGAIWDFRAEALNLIGPSEEKK